MNIKSIFSSSVNPQELSLTVSSLSKTIIGVVAFIAVQKGFDGAVVTSHLQAIMDTVITAIPAGFAMWHAMQTVYGLVRKMFVTTTA